MRLPKFEYMEPRSLKEASKALALDPRGSVLLAGGTDLLVRMKQRLIEPHRIINLKAIPRLSSISEGKEGIRIGALTSLHDITSSPLLTRSYPGLVQSAEAVGAYAHQVMGTLAGNLCQGNRCRYYNQSAFWRGVRPACIKAGGKVCHVVSARPGEGRKPGECYSAYCGDIAPVLIALSAQIQVVGPDKERTLPLKKLYTQKGMKPLSIKKGEILKEILIPFPAGTTLYLKWRLRDSIEFPMISLAVHLEQNSERRIKKAKIVFSGIGPGPVEARATEKIVVGADLNEGLIRKASDLVSREISPMRTSTVSPAYKRKMAGILLGQALEKMMGTE